jgi:hypothetical protein
MIHHGDTEARRNLKNLSDNSPARQSWHIEIENQSNPLMCHLQIWKKLCFVNWQNVLNALNFQNDSILHDNIETISAIQLYRLVLNR